MVGKKALGSGPAVFASYDGLAEDGYGDTSLTPILVTCNISAFYLVHGQPQLLSVIPSGFDSRGVAPCAVGIQLRYPQSQPTGADRSGHCPAILPHKGEVRVWADP